MDFGYDSYISDFLRLKFASYLYVKPKKALTIS